MDRQDRYVLLNAEGRDKFCKAIQYACRILKHRFELHDTKESKQTALKFKALFGTSPLPRKHERRP